MNGVITAIGGFIFGTMFGALTMCLCSVASKADEDMEDILNDGKRV